MQLKKLIPIPIILLALSVFIISHNYVTTKDFIIRDIDLKGGTLITIDTDKQFDTKFLENELSKRFGSVIISSLKSSTGYGLSIQLEANVNSTDVLNHVKNLGINVKEFSVESIGSSFGEALFSQLMLILTISFALMSFIIFIIYRNLISSLAMVFAVLGNIITTLAITSFLGIKISFAGLAGLLMLIGYSVDTNILLTHKVSRSTKEEFYKNYKKAFITGVTLISTITLTMLAIYFLSTSKLLTNIASILIIGFLSDLPYTWIFNAAILELWVYRRFEKL